MTGKAPQVRLDRLLANLGYGSRREVAALVMHRQVELDGVALRDAGARIALTPDLSSHEDLLAEELRLAARALGRLTGRVDVDDILNADGTFSYEFSHSEAARVIIRQYFLDRATQSRGAWSIERTDAGADDAPSKRALMGSAEVNARIKAAFEADGADVWYVQGFKEKVLSGIVNAQDYEQVYDVLDVWFDSGSTHAFVLEDAEHFPGLAGVKRVRDGGEDRVMYLEGSDQHRGWFQSSLWTAIAVKGSAPYRAVLTHGFVVNEKRQKISKSDGKPQTADDYVKKYGADIVRLWVASENYQSDIPLSDAIFETISNQYRSMRNSLRYQLGNLYDFDAAQHAVPVEKMTAIDRWVLVETAKLVREVTDACERNEFHRAAAALAGFTTGTLSATYHNVVKDRLYTTAPDDPMRRSTQTAIDIVLRAYLKLIAPFVPFTADEAWSHLNAKSEYTDAANVHLQDWPAIDARWEDAAGQAAHAAVTRIQTLAAQVNVPLERLRQEKKIGTGLDCNGNGTPDAVTIRVTPKR